MALVAGSFAPVNQIMGHAGASWSGGQERAKRKSSTLEIAGAVLTDHPSRLGSLMSGLLRTRSLPRPQVSYFLCFLVALI